VELFAAAVMLFTKLNNGNREGIADVPTSLRSSTSTFFFSRMVSSRSD